MGLCVVQCTLNFRGELADCVEGEVDEDVFGVEPAWQRKPSALVSAQRDVCRYGLAESLAVVGELLGTGVGHSRDIHGSHHATALQEEICFGVAASADQ